MDRKSPDWIRWVGKDEPGCTSSERALALHEPTEILREVLGRLPGRETKTIAHLGLSPLLRDRSLVAGFGRTILLLDPADAQGVAAPMDTGVEYHVRSLDQLESFHGRIDVLLAEGSLAREDVARLDDALDRALRCLTDGGLLAATFPAVPRDAAAREVRLRVGGGSAVPTLHEVELQYRLRRAGFRGVRILRLEAPGAERPRSLLCLAVRRANN